MIVLDTHIWFWWINLEHERLPDYLVPKINEASRIGVAAVSCFEIALAEKRGRLQLSHPTAQWFELALAGSGVELLPLTTGIAQSAVSLTEIHRDPFDRIIIATALAHGSKLASVDGHFIRYPELHGRLLGSRPPAS